MSEFVTVSLAKALEMAREKQKEDSKPAWKRFYESHRDQELARRREYRRQHKEKIAEYNRRYRAARKKKKAVYTDPTILFREAIRCST